MLGSTGGGESNAEKNLSSFPPSLSREQDLRTKMVKQALSSAERNVWNRKCSGKGARAKCLSDRSGAGWSAGSRFPGEA